jgi:hypothetical protein
MKPPVINGSTHCSRGEHQKEKAAELDDSKGISASDNIEDDELLST